MTCKPNDIKFKIPEICQSILQSGLDKHATPAYLQVHNLNEKAMRIYKKLGFSILYSNKSTLHLYHLF